MLKCTPAPLSINSQAVLSARAKKVLSKAGRYARYCEAKRLFAQKSNATFEEIRQKLLAAGPADEACIYCERDRPRDIDHIRPQRHFPEQAFDWDNYVYSCAICNQDEKRDFYGVIGNTGTAEVLPSNFDFDSDIPLGTDILINVRVEDPGDFIRLDLQTGTLIGHGDSVARFRGEITILLFHLNSGALTEARRRAILDYRFRIERLSAALRTGDQHRVGRAQNEIAKMPYPTVLREMLRQRSKLDWLNPLLSGMP